MGKLCKMVWMGIALFGAYELGRLSKACDRVEEQIINKMGLLTPEEEKYDSVVGHLTANDVFDRISKHYKESKEDA